jgi:hypothetical protein
MWYYPIAAYSIGSSCCFLSYYLVIIQKCMRVTTHVSPILPQASCSFHLPGVMHYTLLAFSWLWNFFAYPSILAISEIRGNKGGTHKFCSRYNASRCWFGSTNTFLPPVPHSFLFPVEIWFFKGNSFVGSIDHFSTHTLVCHNFPINGLLIYNMEFLSRLDRCHHSGRHPLHANRKSIS